MVDMQKLQENKKKIVSLIKHAGPSFPTRISRTTGVNPLIVSAFLSELVSEKQLKISHLKVGSSPLYFISEQEPELQKFIEHLNVREKEAFSLLKDSKILEDEKQPPAIRVALRHIKDFAQPLEVRINNQTRLFWKFFLISNEETKSKIKEILAKKTQVSEIDKTKKEVQNKKEPSQIFDKILPEKEKTPNYSFSDSLKKYLSEKNIKIMENISSKKKEFISKIKINTHFGKQMYYLIAKNKKKITEIDLTLALHKAQAEKMMCLFLSNGELNKKSKEYLSEWENLLKFEQIKT